MAAFNRTVDDSSPLIRYEPANAWTDSPADPLLANYAGSTYHSTTTAGATATFTFNGTGIWVYGALRPDHGHFTAQIDGGPPSAFQGFSQTPVTKFMLVGASGFPMGMHTLVLTNSPTGSDNATGFDLDEIVVQTKLLSSGTPETMTLDDSSPDLSYSGTWSDNPQAFFYDKTSHTTQTPGASMALDFAGEAVAIYGSTSPSHSPYTVTVDGHSTSYTPSASGVHSSTVLFLASDLGPGKHHLTITNNGQTNEYLDVDYVQTFYSQGASNSSAGSAGGHGAGQSASSRGLTGGALVGIVAGAILLLSVTAAALVFYILKQRKSRRNVFDSRKPIIPTAVTQNEKRGDLEAPQRAVTRPAMLGDFGPARPARPDTLLLSPTMNTKSAFEE